MSELTIGLPVYNDKKFIQQSIDSILNQSFRDFVLIISDDCSTDGSGAICLQYAQTDSRIKYIRQEKNIGISRNMQFLLSQAKTKYFMWAGDDDIMHSDFVTKLHQALEDVPTATSAFCTSQFIDEQNRKIKTIDYNYQNNNTRQRVKNYIKNSSDVWGYGMFRTTDIAGVEFPVWWWPNAKTPYNNIYPTLAYYLAKGDFTYLHGEPLFYKRVKTELSVNHIVTGGGNGIKESLAFWIRRFNLVVFTIQQLKHARGLWFALYYIPCLLWYWFVVPSWQQFVLLFKALLRRLRIG